MALASCTQLTLAWTDLDPRDAPAVPPILGAFGSDGPVEGADQWPNRARALRRALEDSVYGRMPDAAETRVTERRVLNESAFNGKGVLEAWRIAPTARFGDEAIAARGRNGEEGFVMNVAAPKAAAGRVPVILMETFCPRWSTLPDPSNPPPGRERGPGSGGFLGGVETFVFGRYICTPPVETILSAGYAIATIYPGEFVPDRREEGLAALRRLSAGHADDETRWGAIAAWAFAYSRMVDALEADERFDRSAFISFGHSRYAKSALLAAAFDARIDGVIAHQSGTGGASLNRGKVGESVASITENYPHWFARAYARYVGREDEMPIDQHALLALIAPRPVLLGNARRDVWSDPEGAFRAAMGADPAYELLGSQGLKQVRLVPFDPSADLSFWIRPGTHGIVKEDWPAFLDFLDAHFARPRPDA
jgi:hypothetical protein